MTAEFNITARTNEAFDHIFTLKLDSTPVDVTGWNVGFQVRDFPESATALLDLTIGSGATIYDGPAGKIRLYASETTMAALTAGVRHADLQLVPSAGHAVVPFAGRFTVKAGVTR